MEAFAIRNLSFTYPGQSRPALDGIDLTLEKGGFLVLCGPSGCGKSTLLRQLKPELAPHGQRTGDISFRGAALSDLSQRESSAKIGFVGQDPERQIVTDKVWHELAFGLESLGCKTPEIRRRVAEMASFFGIQTWFHRPVAELSGGQKQLLNLASVMVLQPEVLILDEPTSQLDPIAAADLISTVERINRELGTAVLMTEHRLDEVLPLATAVAVMERGRMVHCGTAGEVCAALRERPALLRAMPEPVRIWSGVERDEKSPCPITMGQGRRWLEGVARAHPLLPLKEENIPPAGDVVLRAKDAWFRYEKDGADIVKGLNLTVRRGEFVALLGGNGAGKTTALGLLAGINRPWRGRCEALGRTALLPQDPQTLFVKKTVREELLESLDGAEFSRAEREERAAEMARSCRLEPLLERHPYDLSGGEQQRTALAKVLLHRPEVLLLDEPTKGLDAEYKQVFAAILRQLLQQGVAVLMVSHDVAFCAEFAHRCALFFDGTVTAEGTPRAFFSGNSFYTTAANRMARSVLPEAVTVGDVVAACGGAVPGEPEVPSLPQRREEEAAPKRAESAAAPQKEEKLPLWRKVLAICSAALSVFLASQVLRADDLSDQLSGAGAVSAAALAVGLLAALLVFALSIMRGTEREPRSKRSRLPRRTVAAALIILLLVPCTVFFGMFVLEDRHYYLTALFVLFEIMLPFFMVFEGRKPQTRELVLLAALCALGTVGRLAFFMLPQFSPVMALVILSGVALGGETGFLVGAVTMLVSNMALSQGPWTPWQMFAMGLVGFFAGVLFQKGWLGRNRGALCAYGVLAAIVLYGGIMNPASALMWLHELSPEILLAYYITGFPMDCVQAAGTAAFLWLFSVPMLEKLERIRVKYGLVEAKE